MPYDTPGGTGDGETGLSRRTLVASVGGLLAAGLAGCTEVTSQEFAASPVRLPEAVRDDLVLPELFADAETSTLERTIGDQDVEVAITNRFAGYRRSSPEMDDIWWVRARPTLVDRFVGMGQEATPGAGNIWTAINVLASDLAFGQSNPAYVGEDVAIAPDEVTLVVPETARHDGEVRLEELLAVHHAEALGVDGLTSTGGANYLVDAMECLPDTGFAPIQWSTWTPDERWVPGVEGWIPDQPDTLRCVVCLGEQSPESVFGVEEMPGRLLDEGETVETADTLVMVPAPKEYPEPDGWVSDPAAVFDAGYPAPLGGPTFGLGVLATPNAEVAGESVNPLARVGVRDLLTRDLASEVLGRAGLTDADQVEWVRGPRQVPGTAWNPDGTATVLGEEVELRIFGGVVSGEAGPWAVAVHAAKAPGDDVVFPAAVHRRPVGTPDGRELFGDGTGFVDRQWTTRALGLTAEALGSLVVAEDA